MSDSLTITVNRPSVTLTLGTVPSGGSTSLTAGLTSLSSLPTVADRIAYSTAADVWAETAITALGRSLIGRATAALMRGDIGVDRVSALTPGATPAVDCSLGEVFTDTVGQNQTIANPTNGVAGRVYTFAITMNGTGGYWVDWGSAFAKKPSVSQVANATTLLHFYCDGTSFYYLGDEKLRIFATADQSDSGPTDTAVPGLTFTPVPSATYYVRAVLMATTAATTTGLQFRIDPGNATGGYFGVGQSNSGTTISRLGVAGGTTQNVLGGAMQSTTVPSYHYYEAVLFANASPTAILAKFQTEIGGSAVTVKSSSYLEITRLA